MISFRDSQVSDIHDALGNARQIAEGPHKDEHSLRICMDGIRARLAVLDRILKEGVVEVSEVEG